MESWDDENFKPPDLVKPVVPAVIKNKWEGEDEEEEVKESWEDEDEEQNEEEEKPATEVKKPKKKSVAEKVAEKERMRREEMAKRLKELQEEEISEEEKIRMQKESDLKLALETTFGGSDVKPTVIDGLTMPETKEEFQEFSETLSKKLTPLSKSPEYINFVEALTRNLCAIMMSADIKRVKNTLDNLHLEKQKIEKGDKAKKNKGKGKAKLKLEGENDLSQLSAYVNDFDDYDDFM